jgi:hypothetical protein
LTKEFILNTIYRCGFQHLKGFTMTKINKKIVLMLSTLVFAVPAFGQLSSDQTGVQNKALQHNFEDFMSFSYTQGQLCQNTLKKVIPGIINLPKDYALDVNSAGIITSRWKQEVVKPNGESPVVWRFECVSQIRSGGKLSVLSLVMYQQRGGEKRGVEILTNRDFRINYEPK